MLFVLCGSNTLSNLLLTLTFPFHKFILKQKRKADRDATRKKQMKSSSETLGLIKKTLQQ